MSLDHQKQKKGLSGIKVIQTNFWQKRVAAFNRGREQMQKLINNPNFIAGAMLYWAEGSKSCGAEVANSDPNLIMAMIKWLEKFYNIPPTSIAVQMHIHSGQNEQNLRQYWAGITKIPSANFQQSYIKPEGKGHRTKKLYYGTIKIRVRGVGSTYLLFQILGAIAEYNQINLAAPVDIKQWIPKPTHAQ